MIQRTPGMCLAAETRAVPVKLRWLGSANSFHVILYGTDSLHTTQPYHSRKLRKAFSAEN